VYRYVGQDILMQGSDWQAQVQIARRLSLTGTASLIRAREAASKAFVQQMPSDRYRIEAAYKEKRFSLSLNGQWVHKQWRLPGNLLADSLDFTAPPKGYLLVGAVVSKSYKLAKLRLVLSIEATNLLNARYRDYLDRFRYFADAQGRNVMLRLSVPFNLSKSI
jgi:iron complex outermembrane receptor protein